MTATPTVATDGSVSLIAEFTALPGQRDTIAHLIGTYATRVQAEPGNITFVATQNAANPDLFLVFEIYSSEAAFQNHINTPEGAAFNAELEPKIFEPHSNLTWLTVVPTAASTPTDL